MCQQITGAALSAYLPTFTSENGFKGATAQIATLAPYGSAAVVTFDIYLGAPSTAHKARFAALVLAGVGHYVCTPLIVTWQAHNAGNESRRAVAVPGAVSLAQAVAVGSGYLFPSTDSPKYTMGSAVILALSCAGAGFTGLYQFLVWRENRKRDEREGGPPAPDFKPDTATYADDAPGFRYLG
uniref:Uncharacterized protein n=1 Tax=Kwoniella dejecticola CBS 10117 TaxID=1296121 RepID=A0A1A6A8N2_9TREE|nr:uncharacterized protein I303_02423 [Kwoniella dejecticola CBS 10117]OBR86416.1 hypothetical protein I303_02423 [Kwoniella dejecticola CBS 10117]